MKFCPGCAKLEIKERIAPEEKACWLCLRTGYEPPQVVKYNPLYNQYKISTRYRLPPGWYRDDRIYGYIGPNGEYVHESDVAFYGTDAFARAIKKILRDEDIPEKPVAPPNRIVKGIY